MVLRQNKPHLRGLSQDGLVPVAMLLLQLTSQILYSCSFFPFSTNFVTHWLYDPGGRNLFPLGLSFSTWKARIWGLLSGSQPFILMASPYWMLFIWVLTLVTPDVTKLRVLQQFVSCSVMVNQCIVGCGKGKVSAATNIFSISVCKWLRMKFL